MRVERDLDRLRELVNLRQHLFQPLTNRLRPHLIIHRITTAEKRRQVHDQASVRFRNEREALERTDGAGGAKWRFLRDAQVLALDQFCKLIARELAATLREETTRQVIVRTVVLSRVRATQSCEITPVGKPFLRLALRDRPRAQAQLVNERCELLVVEKGQVRTPTRAYFPDLRARRTV
jgi:hypothetical protein